MELKGSMTEHHYRAELEQGASVLLERGNLPILRLLQEKCGAIHSAYFLSGYILADYRNFCILVNGQTICRGEITGEDLESFEKMSILEYKKKLKKSDQIKLEVALELSNGKQL
jgi:hypothetical protein